jgi:hypothetical protein
MNYTQGSNASRKGVPGMNQWNYGMQKPGQGQAGPSLPGFPNQGAWKMGSQQPQTPNLPWFPPTQQLPPFQTNFQSNLPSGGSVFATPGATAGMPPAPVSSPAYNPQTPWNMSSPTVGQPQTQTPGNWSNIDAHGNWTNSYLQSSSAGAVSPVAAQPTAPAAGVGNFSDGTSAAQGNIMAQGAQAAESAMRGIARPGFSMTSPGLQSLGMVGAGQALSGAANQAQQLALNDRQANAQYNLDTQTGRWQDIFGKISNALGAWQQGNQYNMGNNQVDLAARQAQQGADVNWLNLLQQSRQSGASNWLDYLGNMGNLYGQQATGQNQFQNSVIQTLLGLGV